MFLNDLTRSLRKRYIDGAKRAHQVLTTAALAAVLFSSVAVAAPSACDLRLSIELTPDVPNPADDEFLSSLVGNHPSYQLTLEQQRDGSVIVVELSGPGPAFRCESVVEAMRKDGRVLSVRVD
jgi:hypothetical protein